MITGIIMASGFSKRMGENKLLLEMDGVKMIERIIRSCKDSSLDEIILVYREAAVKDLGIKYHIKTVFNPKAHLGQSESMKAGITAAQGDGSFMFIMGDQPYITGGLIDRLIREYKAEKQSIIVPYYQGKRGNPVIFPSGFRDELLQVEGDKGGRDIIKQYNFLIKRVDVENRRLGWDFDSKEDLKAGGSFENGK